MWQLVSFSWGACTMHWVISQLVYIPLLEFVYLPICPLEVHSTPCPQRARVQHREGCHTMSWAFPLENSGCWNQNQPASHSGHHQAANSQPGERKFTREWHNIHCQPMQKYSESGRNTYRGGLALYTAVLQTEVAYLYRLGGLWCRGSVVCPWWTFGGGGD